MSRSAAVAPARSSSAADRPLAATAARSGLASAVGRGGWMHRGWLRLATGYREWRLGIATGGSIEADRLSSDPDAFGYQPIPYDVFDAALGRVSIQPGRDVFLDFGCGKGRAVVLAALRPFRRVIGIELSPALAAAASENVHRARRFRRTEQVELITADARNYVVPSDVSVIHLFNPFDDRVLAQVLQGVHASWVEHPRRLTIVSTLPRGRRDLLDDFPWLGPADVVPTARQRWLRTTVRQACDEGKTGEGRWVPGAGIGPDAGTCTSN